MAHCTPQEAKMTRFAKVEVTIMNRCGLKQKVELCVKTWCIVVAGMGKSTLEKVRASIPDQIQQQRLMVAQHGYMVWWLHCSWCSGVHLREQWHESERAWGGA
jgi:hypothetical protein